MRVRASRTPVLYNERWKEKILTIPDQAIPLREILTKFVRNIPVAVPHKDPVWVDQSDYDYERVARSEFSEKISIAEELRERYDSQMRAIKEERERRERDEQKAALLAEMEAEKVSEAKKAAGEAAEA